MYTSLTNLVLLFLLSTFSLNAQIYNTEVEAKINIDTSGELMEITGSAFNKTEITQSIHYVLSVIKTTNSSNRSKNDQKGRLILQPLEKENLSKTSINSIEKDQIIILLLVYDLDDNIIGKDRIVINEMESHASQNNKSEENYNSDVKSSTEDGVILKGIVVEDTKTKPGRDFYTMFYATYVANNINGKNIVSIKELLAIGSNTKIEVKVGETVVFEFFVRPRQEYLKSMTDAAIRRVHLHFQQLDREAGKMKRY
jgi:hypothetical protein